MVSNSENVRVPNNSAQFPGSFAASLRADHRKSPENRSWRCVLENYFFSGWNDINIWKSAFVEFVGTTVLCYISAMINITTRSFGPAAVAGYVGISTVFLLTLIIYSMAVASGGHANPFITFCTMVTGLTGFSRGTLYLVSQTLGAALAGGLLRGSFGEELAKVYQGGGCHFDTKLLKVGQIYILESVLCFCLIFLCFGVGLDPRLSQLYGPKLGPLLVGCSVALIASSSVGLAEGYPGPGLNPARCFSAAVARGNFDHQWIWWFGPTTAALALMVVYNVAPPLHREIRSERANARDNSL